LISFSDIDLAEIIGAVDTASVLSSSEDEDAELSTSLTSGAVFRAEIKFKTLSRAYSKLLKNFSPLIELIERSEDLLFPACL
jgi:hypothetical protein